MAARGPRWQAWIDELPGVAAEQLDRWTLRLEGTAASGTRALVLPVRTSEGAAAVLKLGFPDTTAEHAHLVLRRWGGAGAVRLLSADPPRHALLLERLRPAGPHTAVEACEAAAELYGRLHVPALPQLRSLASCVADWLHDFEALPRSAPVPHRMVEQATALARDLTTGTDGADRVLHGDLHYGHLLSADRAPWLAISPRPVNGDPHFELAPMLWHRWTEVDGHVRSGVQHRFFTLVDAGGFDEDRARGWVLVRVVREAVRAVSAGANADVLTKYVTLAKAIQD